MAAGGITQDDIQGILLEELAVVLPTALLESAEARAMITLGLDMALESGDPRLVAELEAQLAGLAEIEKIKVTKGALRAGVSLLRAGARVGILALGGA